jgi:hypothetical protein
VIHKATLSNEGRITTDTIPGVGDTIEVENHGRATVNEYTHTCYNNYITVTWEDGFQRRTYWYSVVDELAA